MPLPLRRTSPLFHHTLISLSFLLPPHARQHTNYSQSLLLSICIMIPSTTTLLILALLGTEVHAWPKWSSRDQAVADTGNTGNTGNIESSSGAASGSTSMVSMSVSATPDMSASPTGTANQVDASSAVMSSMSLSSGSMSMSSASSGAASATANSAAAAPTPTGDFVTQPFPYPLNTSLDGNSAYISSQWSGAHQKARARLQGWTQEEKVNLTTGAGWSVGRCVGNINPIPSQNFDGLCLEDSPLGVRFADFVSAFPAGINVAST